MKSSETKKEGVKHAKARLGEFLKEKLEIKVMDGQYIRSRPIYKERICEEHRFR
jgi:hypothetical protein